MAQLPFAGMFAFVRVTPVLVVVKPICPPVHEVWAATVVVAVGIVRLLGSAAEKLDCVNAKPLVLVKVMVNVEVTFSLTLSGEKPSDIAGAAGLTASAVGQAVVPALRGVVDAAVTEPLEPTVRVAVSTAPALSVTVKVTVPLPLAMIVTFDAFAPETITTVGPDVVQP